MVEGQNSIAKWTLWLEGYATQEYFWEPLSKKTPINVAIGYSHAFIGGHFIFRLPGFEAWVDRMIPTHSLNDEIFLSRKMSSASAIIITALSFILGVLMMLMLINFIRKFKSIKASLGNVIIPLLVSWIVYSIFFCVWVPENLEFWLLQAVWLWLMLIGSTSVAGFPLRFKPAAGIAILSLTLFVVNFFGSIRWILDLDNDLYYEKIEPIKDTATSKDVILLQDGWITKDFLLYYTQSQVEAVDTGGHRVDNSITHCLTNGGRVFIYTEDRTMKRPTHETYIDSLLTVFNSRKSVFRKSNPEIYVIQ
jgi:hypothetical protein